LDRIGLPEEKIELLLEEINVRCFKREMEEKELLSKLDEIFQMAYELDIPISDVLVKISQRQRE
jgi:predicted HAD superfamily phosphohydrolase